LNTNTTQLPEWQRLAEHATVLIKRPLSEIVDTAGRLERFSFVCDGLLVDLSKQRLTNAALRTLCELGARLQLPEAIARLMQGDTVNITERRAALHTALRAPRMARPAAVRELVETQLQRMRAFSDQLRTGAWRGFTGKAIRDVVHIGIGGSHLGPELVTEALAAYRHPRLHCHFLANIDGDAAHSILQRANPETTLFIVASKSFSTVETRVNAATARSWLLERCGRLDAIEKHFVAVTSNVEAAAEFGIPDTNVFAMWDWVGGRYSLWSAVGLPIAIAIGADLFDELLAGAYAMDRHAQATPLEWNLPMLLALVGIWNYNVLGAQSHAVLTYDRRLRLLSSFLQQLEMESNGKSVRLDSTPVDLQTMPVLWGGEETNAQHAFHQQLHQGNRAFSVDFLASVAPAHQFDEHHRWLLANCLAQSQALMQGRRVDAGSDALASHRTLAGNRPSTTILLDALTPRTLGMLLALYEHKTFCQGIIWQINSFDQWGVDLGKVLAEAIHDEMAGQQPLHHDPSTSALLRHIRQQTNSRPRND
jgi:glucose-6-phosphate isomerase